MKIFAETDRLILRALVPSDKNGIFELDSDPEVHRYLGNKPISSPEQAVHTIELIRQQYVTHGIGRWAAIEKNSHNFVGWAGLKLNTETINNHIDFYDVGYRFIKKYWGKGYAAETAKAAVQYGFHQLGLKHIYGMAHIENKASIKVLKKTGLRYIETFDYNGAQADWFEATKNS